VGRSVKVKRKVVEDVVRAIALDPGVDAEHVMIAFKETSWENWSFGGGRLLHV
jgi:phenylpyruvate tautomerase PptA (4-oxalocrotonate tautomerase family)